MQPELAPADLKGAPVRVVHVDIPNHVLSEELFGPGIHVPRCQVIFRHMLPVPPDATLQHVTRHGIVLVFEAPPAEDEPSPNGLMVPWGQVSYLKFFHG
jgi:hypothetical protein